MKFFPRLLFCLTSWNIVDILINILIVFQMVLEAIESENTQMFFQMLHFSLRDKDRFHVISGKSCDIKRPP